MRLPRLRRRETRALDWSVFSERMNALSVAQFQQRTRNESARNATKRTISDAERTQNAKLRQEIKRQRDGVPRVY